MKLRLAYLALALCAAITLACMVALLTTDGTALLAVMGICIGLGGVLIAMHTIDFLNGV